MLNSLLSPGSSSFHCVNADRRLGPYRKHLYLFLNRLNNFMPGLFLDSRIEQSYFSQFDLKGFKIGDRSPSRLLSDLFWKNLNWKWLKDSVGGLRVLDLGCGRGGYLKNWVEFSDGLLDDYHGIDPSFKEQWRTLSETYPFAKFEAKAAVSLKPEDLDTRTLILSQSVIEHIEDDLNFFRMLANYLGRRARPLIQIHLVPSAPCLEKYLYHGVRQFTPRTLSRITKLFSESKIDLLSMGGTYCNKVHLRYITHPIFKFGTGDRRKSELQSYQVALNEAVVRDLEERKLQNPSFYALILQHQLPNLLSINGDRSLLG